MPVGDCQHSGTYNGHPVSVAAGLAAIQAYREAGFYDHIHAVARELYEGLNELFSRHSIDAVTSDKSTAPPLQRLAEL